jgi:hypothetical protein
MRPGVGTVGLALFLAWLPVAMAAQTAQVGQVIGDVRDATGGVVRGAKVTITSSERGISRTTVTDSVGRFLFAAVPPGRYDLVVALSKFTPAKLTGNTVEAEKATRVSVMVDPATIEDKVTVVGEAPRSIPRITLCRHGCVRTEFRYCPSPGTTRRCSAPHQERGQGKRQYSRRAVNEQPVPVRRREHHPDPTGERPPRT